MPSNRNRPQSAYIRIFKTAMTLNACGIAMLCLAGCETTNQGMAGTSTSVGTNVGGTALTKAGRPAGKAQVTLRSEEVTLRDGKPEGLLLAETKTDTLGHFTIHAPAGISYLRITCGKECGESENETWLSVLDLGQDSEVMREIRLSPPGGLRGVLTGTNGISDTGLWLGVAGTDLFRRPYPTGQNGSAIEILDVPAGMRLLQWVTTTRADIPAFPLRGDSVEVPSGAILDLGEDFPVP